MASLTLLLFACDVNTPVQKSAVSINSRAFFTVFQEGPGAPFESRLIGQNNTTYRPISISFTVPKPDSPYTVVFVCPSKGVKPHEVYVFYATPAEMNTINFTCKRAQDEILLRPIYGKISGVTLPTVDSPVAEKARIAFSRDSQIDGWEGFATKVRAGQRDIIALKGAQAASGDIDPSTLYINRGVSQGISEDSVEIDVDFTGADNKAFLADFDAANASTVNISGAAAGETIISKVGFVTTNKSYLELAASSQSSYSFIPVPLGRFQGAVANFTNKAEFNPGEGHELVAEIDGSDGLPQRKVYKYFTESIGETHNVVIPRALPSQPVVGVRGKSKYQEVILNWNAYNDSAAGNTLLYRWTLQGGKAEPSADYPDESNIGEARWILQVTPGWAKAVNGSSSNFSIVLPTSFTVTGTVDKRPPWHEEWAFKSAADIEWEFSAVEVKSRFTAEAVVEHFLNGNFDILSKDSSGAYNPNDFEFGEVLARGVAR
ncbi:MAG: hypothetical protein R3240_01480 [Gammaproteobacteria bacterium]|nr:hypothetical protein [Gammaproteobacteria bacterium]